MPQTAHPAPTLAGGCRCGQVRYHVAAPQVIFACHCTDCQRFSASAFAIGSAFAQGGINVGGIEA